LGSLKNKFIIFSEPFYAPQDRFNPLAGQKIKHPPKKNSEIRFFFTNSSCLSERRKIDDVDSGKKEMKEEKKGCVLSNNSLKNSFGLAKK